MSSTSSSEYENEDYWLYENYNRPYGNAFGSNNPFYSTMGHPLIYYAKVPQPAGMRQCGRERRRDSPNCFVKAFRWYTEEHVPKRTVPPTMQPNMTGFAAWLDDKYNQYLLDVQMDPKQNHLKLKQTTVIETERISSDYCKPCTAKRFPVISPWSKNHRARSNEKGDTVIRSCHSFQYLLQPKDLSGHASEICRSSTATIKSECPKRSAGKTQSCSNILNNSKSKAQIDDTIQQRRVNSRITSCQRVCQKNACKGPEKSLDAIKLTSATKVPSKDFACQFPAEKITKVNTETQYNVLDSLPPSAATVWTKSEVKQADCECPQITQKSSMKIPVRKIPSNVSKPCSNTGSKQKYFYCECPEQSSLKRDVQTQYVAPETFPVVNMRSTGCSCDLKEITQSYAQFVQSMTKIIGQCIAKQQDTCSKVPINICSEAAQTSDYAIRFGKNAIHEYPLFMKIVCADKLSKENVE